MSLNTRKRSLFRGNPPCVRGRVPRRAEALASRLVFAAGILVALATGHAHAVGLGSVEVATGLNERLDGRIPVRNLDGHPPDAISVGLAAPARFRAAGIERRPHLQQLRFTLERTTGGGHVIRVRSSWPVVEPFVRSLLELESPTGRLVREYTMLLDRPVAGEEEQGVAVTDAVEAEPSASESPESAGQPTGSTETVSAGDNGDRAETRYGPVQKGSSA